MFYFVSIVDFEQVTVDLEIINVVLVFLLLTLHMFKIFSSVSIVEFEPVYAS